MPDICADGDPRDELRYVAVYMTAGETVTSTTRPYRLIDTSHRSLGPAALFISASFAWRAVFFASGGLLLLIGVLLARMMPADRPGGGLHYGQIITTTARLPAKMPALCWRSAYAALMFGAFNMFWTAAPLMLADHFYLGQHAIGLFALAGAGGALAAPWAGRLSYGGREVIATLGAMVVMTASFIGCLWGTEAAALPLLVVCAVLIDASVQTNAVVSRRTVFGTAPTTAGRSMHCI